MILLCFLSTIKILSKPLLLSILMPLMLFFISRFFFFFLNLASRTQSLSSAGMSRSMVMVASDTDGSNPSTPDNTPISSRNGCRSPTNAKITSKRIPLSIAAEIPTNDAYQTSKNTGPFDHFYGFLYHMHGILYEFLFPFCKFALMTTLCASVHAVFASSFHSFLILLLPGHCTRWWLSMIDLPYRSIFKSIHILLINFFKFHSAFN